MNKPKGSDEKVLVRNRRATFDYEITERFEAGISLLGSEVKSLRAGTADLTDAWAQVERGELWLKNMTVQPMPHAAFPHEMRRARKLLLHRREIEQIQKELDRGGATLVPLRVYLKEGRIKLELALGHGKKKADKRQAIKTREADREARVAMARSRKG
jgi:SsrA-binding protein